MKLLVWLLFGLLVYWALRSQMKRNQQKRNQERYNASRSNSTHHYVGGSGRSSAQPSPHTSTPVESMVACSYCQIYLPASEAIHQPAAGSSEHYFCSAEHAELHAKSSSKQSAE